MENHPYVMESSVLVHECTLRNIDLVADFFFVNGSDSSTGSNETFSQFIKVVGILGLCKLPVF